MEYCYQMKISYGITLSAKNSIEIDFKSTEGLKMIISCFDRPIIRITDEKHIVKHKHCSPNNNNSYKTCQNNQNAMHEQQDSSLPLIWLRNRHSKTIDRNFLRSTMTVAFINCMF